MQVALKTINPAGPCPANIMIVADSPGIEEINMGIPFTGYAMRTLTQMLAEKGIALNQCYRTHALKVYAPQDAPEAFVALKKKEISYEHVECNGKFVLQILRDHIEVLRHEIARVKPNVIIALGNVALFALTGNWSINAWRGSVLKCILNTELGYDVKVIPTYHPRQINKMWAWRVIGLQDLKRAKLESKDYSFPALVYNFLLKPSYEQCLFVLDQLIMQLDTSLVIKEISVDIETKYGTIECIALAWTDTDAICIPFITQSPYNNIYPFYFTVDQETEIIYRIYKITTHKNCRVIGQNLTYDMQYIQKQWLFIMNGYEDTLIGQHTLFSTLPKDLSFLSSMYLPYHKHWKEDGKGDPPDMQRWHYNAEDACKTYAIRQVQKQALAQSGLSHLDDFQQTLNYHVQRMIYKGVKIDLKKRAEFDQRIQGMIKEREDKLEYILGYLPNIKSPAQMAVLFYEDLGMKVQKSKKTGSTSTDDEALTKIAAKEPLVKPIVQMITELRSLYVFLNTFIRARLSDDGRLRTTFKVGGTVTYRFASSEDAFGNGANLQNIPDGKRSTVELPNVRELFIPDDGHTMFDVDLDSADLRIVTWEADVKEMKAMLAEGLKIYVEVMKEYFKNPNMTKHSKEYSMFKSLCHGTNYVGTAKGLAERIGLLVHEVDKIQKWYFGKFPEILRWHNEVRNQVMTKKMISNIFGYRKYFFDRLEGTFLNEAVAWIPQSTVACIINRALVTLQTQFPALSAEECIKLKAVNPPQFDCLKQVHDSLTGQYPKGQDELYLKAIKEAVEIKLPYKEPLIIPAEVHCSDISWGNCK